MAQPRRFNCVLVQGLCNVQFILPDGVLIKKDKSLVLGLEFGDFKLELVEAAFLNSVGMN